VAVFDVLSGPVGRMVAVILDRTRDTLPGISEKISIVIAQNAQKIWQAEAMKTPTAWGGKYADAIKIDVGASGFARVYVDESSTDPRTGKPNILFVNLVEDGMKSFSIKDALLNSEKVHISAKGTRYIHVPFRWRVPVKGQAPASGFAGTMPKAVYDVVKGGGAKLGEYTMKSPTGKMVSLAGLQRYGGGGHSQYLTFRTVSEKSKGWQHPGKRATPVFDKVLSKVESMIEQFLMEFLRVYGDDIKAKTEQK